MIGYYVHHQGDGHVTRAAAIADRLGGEPVTGLSSRPRPDGWRGPWLQLARDDDPADGADPTAGGALHWAPSGHPGLRERMAQIAAWVATHAPRLVVVDVSVEVTVLLRTMGVPTVVMGMPGARHDPAHQLAYRLADAIVAPWPAWARVFGGGAPWRAKTHPVGAISRFDGRRPARERARRGRPRVVVLSGRGGTELTVDMLAAAEHADASLGLDDARASRHLLGRGPVAAALRCRRHRHPRRAERHRRRRGRQAPGRGDRPAATARRATRHRASAASGTARRRLLAMAGAGALERGARRGREAGRQWLGALEHREGAERAAAVLGELACAPR